MYDFDRIDEFIEHRASGKSYAWIASTMDINRKTLMKWGKIYEKEIASEKYAKFEALKEKYSVGVQKKIEIYGDILNDIKTALSQRDYSEVPTKHLLELQIKYMDMINKTFDGVQLESIAEEAIDQDEIALHRRVAKYFELNDKYGERFQRDFLVRGVESLDNGNWDYLDDGTYSKKKEYDNSSSADERNSPYSHEKIHANNDSNDDNIQNQSEASSLEDKESKEILEVTDDFLITEDKEDPFLRMDPKEENDSIGISNPSEYQGPYSNNEINSLDVSQIGSIKQNLLHKNNELVDGAVCQEAHNSHSDNSGKFPHYDEMISRVNDCEILGNDSNEST